MLFSASVKNRVVSTRPVFVVRVDGAGLEPFREWARKLPDKEIVLQVNGAEFHCANLQEVDTLLCGFIAGYRLACQKIAAAVDLVVPAWLSNEGQRTEDIDSDPDLTPDLVFASGDLE